MRRARVAIAGVLAGSMTLAGVGCTPPASEWEAEQRANNFWTFITMVVVLGLCQNTDFCPIPGDPGPVPG